MRRTVFGLPRMNEPSRFLLDVPPDRLQRVNSLGMHTAQLSGFGGSGAVRSWTGAGTPIGGATRPPRKDYGPIERPGPTSSHPFPRKDGSPTAKPTPMGPVRPPFGRPITSAVNPAGFAR